MRLDITGDSNMTMQEKWETVQKLVGGAITTNDMEDISSYRFKDGQTPPTEEEVETAFKAWEYRGKRQAEYDALNQFELMTDDAANSTTTHADAIAAIKTKYPKP
jgi:hypothetical protein